MQSKYEIMQIGSVKLFSWIHMNHKLDRGGRDIRTILKGRTIWVIMLIKFFSNEIRTKIPVNIESKMTCARKCKI